MRIREQRYSLLLLTSLLVALSLGLSLGLLLLALLLVGLGVDCLTDLHGGVLKPLEGLSDFLGIVGS